MIGYRITHVTTYSYTEPVSLCQNVARLIPRDCSAQTCERSSLAIDPAPAVIDQTVDLFGNPVTYFSIQEPHRALRIEATHEVTLTERMLPEAARTLPWESVLDQVRRYRGESWLLASQFLFNSRYVSAATDYAEYARPSFAPGRPILEASFDLTRRIFNDFAYDPRATTVATPTREVFRTRRGVCQDFGISINQPLGKVLRCRHCHAQHEFVVIARQHPLKIAQINLGSDQCRDGRRLIHQRRAHLGIAIDSQFGKKPGCNFIRHARQGEHQRLADRPSGSLASRCSQVAKPGWRSIRSASKNASCRRRNRRLSRASGLAWSAVG